MFDIFSSRKEDEAAGAGQGDAVNLPEARPEGQPGPTGPEGRKSIRLPSLKVIIFLCIIIYGLISHFHAPLLTYLGEYLVITQSPPRSDLIVCLAGGNVERGIGAAEAYHEGYAPRVLITREALPDGYRLLEKRGLRYPESVDLLAALLMDLGVPKSAITVTRQPVNTTLEEARVVRRVVAEKGYRSLILVTSPTHTRRAWLTFKKVFEETPVKVFVLATAYSGFNPRDWWRHEKYLREVAIEYQKMIFYFVFMI